MRDYRRVSRAPEVLASLKQILQELPGVSSVRAENKAGHNDRADVVLTTDIQGRRVQLLVYFTNDGYPRDVVSKAARVKTVSDATTNGEQVPLVASSLISPGGRRLLRERNIGYFDLSGSLFLPILHGLYFVDRPAPHLDRRQPNLYKGRTSQVLVALLSKPHNAWHMEELAEKAGVSTSTAHQVVGVLEKALWVEKHGKGPKTVRVLVKPGDLLNAWALHYPGELNFLHYYLPASSFAELRRRVTQTLGEQNIPYALTLECGAELVAIGGKNPTRLDLIIPVNSDLNETERVSGLQPVHYAANVNFICTRHPSALMFRHLVSQCWVASDVQLYLDLWNSQHGKELADELRNQRLGF